MLREDLLKEIAKHASQAHEFERTQRMNTLDKWAFWSYCIDFWLRYIILIVIAVFFCCHIHYIHNFIESQVILPIFMRLAPSSFNTVVGLGMGGTLLLVLIMGYWFGKDNSHLGSMKIIFDRFKK